MRWVSQEWCTVHAQSEARVAGGSSIKDKKKKVEERRQRSAHRSDKQTNK